MGRGQPVEELPQHVLLLRVERGEVGVGVAPRGLPDLDQAQLALGGQVERVVAAVAGVATTLEEAVLLELVDQRHEAAGQDPELGGDGLLRPTGARGDGPEQAGVRRCQSERGELLGEPIAASAPTCVRTKATCAGPVAGGPAGG